MFRKFKWIDSLLIDLDIYIMKYIYKKLLIRNIIQPNLLNLYFIHRIKIIIKVIVFSKFSLEPNFNQVNIHLLFYSK